MQMDAGLDTGDILEQVICPIEQSDTGGSLHDRLADIAAENINNFLTKVTNQEIVAVKQDEAHSNYANKISKPEAKIDWSKPATEIEKKIRAFNPFPVTHTQINDLNIRIWDAEVKTGSENYKPGTILNNKSSLDIVTGENILSITKLQSAGKRAMTAKEFLNGHADFFDANPVAN